MTGVQRYAQEIVAALDDVLSEEGDIARRLGIRLVLPPGAEVRSALSRIDIRQTRFGSGRAWANSFCLGMRRQASEPAGHEHALRWDAGRAEIPFLNALKRPYVFLLGSRAKHKNVQVILEQAQGFDEAGINVVVAGAASSNFSRRMSQLFCDPILTMPAILATTTWRLSTKVRYAWSSLPRLRDSGFRR
jgi:hypothetical protein